MYTPQTAVGSLTGTGSDLTVVTGFKPNLIEVINVTKNTKISFVYGKSIVINGTAITAGDVITVDDNSFTIPAAQAAASDEITFVAIG